MLQGAASRAKFDFLAEYLGSQTFYHPEDSTESYEEAAVTYFRCRQTGVTIRSAADRLIARVAIEQDLVLPQDDQTFQNMACWSPSLPPPR